MARRRVGAPQAAAGDVWRQQQQLSALAAALQQLPAGDALPPLLLRGLQRALACIDHTLYGPPHDGSSDGGGGGDIGKGDVDVGSAARGSVEDEGGGGGGEGEGGGGSAASDMVTLFGVAEATDGGAERERAGRAAVGWRRRPVAPERSKGCDSLEAVAADRAAGIFRELLVSVMDGGGGSGDGDHGWCGPSYAASLLHGYAVLSSDLFDISEAEWHTTGRAAAALGANGDRYGDGGGGGGARLDFRRDELAAAARRLLPVAVYARLVAALGWERQLFEVTTWVPDAAVASAVLTRVMELCPATAVGLVTALFAAANDDGEVQDVDGDGNDAASPRRDVTARALWMWAPWARRVAHSRGFMVRVALAVRQAVAATEAKGAVEGSDASAAAGGRRWLPCLLLLGQVLAEALRQQAPAAAFGAADVLPAAPAAAAAAGSDATGEDRGACPAWLDVCCDALQEGLCVFQADLLASCVGAAAAEAEADASAAAALLYIVRRELKALVDVRVGGGGRGGGGSGAVGLSYMAAVRLRTRIMVLDMQCGGAGAAAPPLPQPPSSSSAALSACSDIWRDLPCVSAGAGRGVAEPGSAWERPSGRRLPEWLRAATAAAAPPSDVQRAGGIDALQLQLFPRMADRTGPRKTAAAPSAASRPSTAAAAQPQVPVATSRMAAMAVALLTPGVGSWLRVQRDPRVIAAAGPDPYSPFRVALALLELLQGRLYSAAAGGFGSPDHPGDAAAAAVGSTAADMDPAEGHLVGEGDGWWRRRSEQLRVLRMAAECLACVEAPEQQAALQAVVLGSPLFQRLRASLAADAALQAAAGRALVALSNRAAAVEGSLERLALSAQQEAQRLAAAATDLLPYAVLVPEACVRRLVLDGLTHPGQQPWVLQLLRCFAVAAAAMAEPPSAPPVTVLLSCVRNVVLGDAERWVGTSAERRALLGLVAGLLRDGGLLAPRQLLREVLLPALVRRANGGLDVSGRSVQQVHCSMLLAQLVLSGGGAAAADSLPATAFCPATELAAAGPARLLLAVAAVLGDLYDAYDAGRRLEAAAIDAVVGVLERAVQLYGERIAPNAARRAGEDSNVARGELRELEEGCAALQDRRPVAALLPLLELAASSRDQGAGGGDDGDGGAEHIRALAALFAPAAKWRPRSLRTADAAFSRAVMYDTLTFAASGAATAAALRKALRDAAAAVATDGDNGGDGEGPHDVGGVGRGKYSHGAVPSVWSAWGEELSLSAFGDALAAEGVVTRHVASTAARGLLQIPAMALLGGGVQALAAVLPTATPEQARRLLVGLLPALVEAAGGAAVLHAAMAAEGLGGGAAPAPTAESMGIIRTHFLAAPAGRGRDGGGGAAAVALSLVLACRAATVALRSAAAADQTAAPPLLSATADRCAAHLALLASRLVAAAAEAATADGGAQLPCAPPLAAPVVGERPGSGSLVVAAVASVLLSEICGVASVAVAAAPPGCERGLEVWQAIILSVLQCFVGALVAWGRAQLRHQAPPPRQPAVAVAAEVTVRQLLRSAVVALRTLPGPVADVLLGSLERLCEREVEEEHAPLEGPKGGRGDRDAGVGGCGWLSAALHAAGLREGGAD